MGTTMPTTRYARTDDGVHIAYQTLGEGPIDLVLMTWLLNVEAIWGWAEAASVLRRLATISRLIILDRRGTGLSDHAVDQEKQISLDGQMDDVRAVMDAVASERAVLLCFEQIAPASVFAATFPSRTLGLILYEPRARNAWAADYPWGATPDNWAKERAEVADGWGTPELARTWLADLWPERADDPAAIDAFAAWQRHGGGPGDALAWIDAESELDLRTVLPMIRVPTLAIHRTGEPVLEDEEVRATVAMIPGATLAELPGSRFWWQDDISDTVGSFLKQIRREQDEFDRVLATILFTDIVASTETAAARGDRAWADLVAHHHAVVRGLLARYRGTEMDTAGDGFFSTFDGPARAMRCAEAIRDQVRSLGIEVRAGIHTGEVSTIDGKAGGLAVNIGARIAGLAGASEILASQTVKDLTAGSGLAFDDAGEHELKGVPDRWRLYRVIPG
jgi:class 3 adenylate cyclase/pimeloyl-ACP methyl ester carboxylesterase